MLALLLACALADPVQVPLAGRLDAATGAALHGTYDLDVALFDAAVGGNVVWDDQFDATALEDGWFFVHLGSGRTLDSDDLGPGDLWIEASTIDADAPRRRLPHVPQAARAASAQHRWAQVTPANVGGSPGSSYANSGHALDLPAAGTYLVTYTAECFRNGGSRPDQTSARLSSPTIDAVGSPIAGLYGTIGSNAQSHGNVALQQVVTVPGPETVHVQWRDWDSGALSLYSAVFNWVRVD